MTLPQNAVGLGLRSPHFKHFLQENPDLDFIEIIAQNYFDSTSYNRFILEKIRADYPLSLHSVGLNIASPEGVNPKDLEGLKSLSSAYSPFLISDHLCWVGINQHAHNDLLPFPYTDEALKVVVDNVHRVQDILQQPIALENVSAYLEFNTSLKTEAQFLREVVQQTGCDVLLDVNNIYVNHLNLGHNPREFFPEIPKESVKQYHVAGYEDMGGHYVDTHGADVHPPVWDLLQEALMYFPDTPILVERDNNIPDFAAMMTEVERARDVCRRHHGLR